MPAVILCHGKALLLSQQQEAGCWWHKVLPILYLSQLPGSCSRLLSISRVVCTGKELQSPAQPWVSGLMPSSCFLPFLTRLSGNLSCSLPSSSVWDPANATPTDLATTVREICSRKGSILLFRAASCQEFSSKCCPLPPPVLIHCAHSTNAVLAAR